MKPTLTGPREQLLSGIEDDLDILNMEPHRKKEVQHRLYIRYLGALVSIIGIKNHAGVLRGYREGYTRGRLEEMARRMAKEALKRRKPQAMVSTLRKEMENDPKFAKAMVEGWPRESAPAAPAKPARHPDRPDGASSPSDGIGGVPADH